MTTPPVSPTPVERAAELERTLAPLDLVTVAVEASGARVSVRKPRSAEALISDEDFTGDERLPYWADIWPSSRALAGVIRGLEGHGRSLIELGCGIGLVSVTALRAGFHVTASDYYADALEVTRLNALRLAHDADARLTARSIDWRALPDDLGTFDVVCAADVLYEREYAELVADVLVRALTHNGEAWIADPGRVALDAFRQACRERGLVERDHFTALVHPDERAGDLAARARPGGLGMTDKYPGLPPAHRVQLFRYQKGAGLLLPDALEARTNNATPT